MKIEELTPQPEEKVHFTLASFKMVPKQSGCYVLTTFGGAILYVGLSDNLFNRFQQHLDNSEKTNPTKEGKAIWFYFKIYDPKNLPELERTWLNQFTCKHGIRPILNKADSPVG